MQRDFHHGLLVVAILSVVVALVSAAPGQGQDIAVGQRVTLVERDLDVPAHPAPGDHRLPFRFRGGSSVLILAIDAESGWIRLRGARTDGVEDTGWIARHYVQRPPTRGPTAPIEDSALDLAWCPAKGSPHPRTDGRLRLATWNIENLHERDGQSTYAGRNPSVARLPADYARIRCYVRQLDPDILAVQEIDGEEALGRIVDTDVYDLHVSGRVAPRGMNGRQNTGYAYRKGLDVTELPDFRALDISGGALRYGARLSVAHGGQRLQLMSVHLKTGCHTNGSASRDCETLHRQIGVLEDWVDRQAAGPDPFIVLGDFNRRLNEPGDVVWTALDDGQPPNADLTTATAGMPVGCRNGRYDSFIDHIVFGRRATALVDRSSFRHVPYREADRRASNKISDHCPMVVELLRP